MDCKCPSAPVCRLPEGAVTLFDAMDMLAIDTEAAIATQRLIGNVGSRLLGCITVDTANWQ